MYVWQLEVDVEGVGRGGAELEQVDVKWIVGGI